MGGAGRDGHRVGREVWAGAGVGSGERGGGGDGSKAPIDFEQSM